jgi:hypothetical protein
LFTWVRRKIGEWLAAYLSQPIRKYVPFSVTPARILREQLRPGDVLLVEGDKRISVAIKYLTQSTWSHAALYIGNVEDDWIDVDGGNLLIEADMNHGVIAVPLTKYRSLNTRICRPVNLTDEDRQKIVRFMVDRAHMKYDLKHVFDLLRYLLPTPPVPVRWRRRMLSLGSGDPTRAICSTLIAQAFQSVEYPILPKIKAGPADDGDGSRDLYQKRYHGLFTPRDFDLSPYFEVVKPTLERNFDYNSIEWYEDADEPDPAYRPAEIDSPHINEETPLS